MDTEEKTTEQLLKEINEKLDRIEKRQKMEQTALIIKFAAVVLLIAVLLIIFVPKINALISQYRAATAKLEEIEGALKGIDLSAMRETFRKVGEIDLDGLKTVSEKLKNFDFDALENMVSKASGLFSKVGGFFG